MANVVIQFQHRKIVRKWLALAMILGLLLATGITGVTSLPVAQAFTCGNVPDPGADKTGNFNSENAGITSINNARIAEGLPALPHPNSYYTSMSPNAMILALFNDERTARGLPAFANGNDLVLGRVATNHSQILIDFNLFAHDTAIDGSLNSNPSRVTIAPGVSGHYSSWGEIIAGAPYASYQVFLWLYQDKDQGWGHRHIIFGCFSDVGIGYVAGGPYGSMATADFIQSNGSYVVPGSVDTTPPSLSVNPPTFNSASSSNLTVTAVATDSGAGIRHVAFFRDGNFSGATVPAGTANGNTYSYTFTGVPAGNHTISVIAVDKNNNYVRSNVTAVDNPIPVAPTNLTASPPPTANQVNLTWNDNSNNETGFRIERSLTSASGPWTQIATVGPNAGATATYSDTGLLPITTYYYRVVAYNNSGTSAYSNVMTAVTANAIPNPPTNLSAQTVSSTQINLAWTDNSNNETDFKIERSTNNFSSFTTLTAGGANITSVSDNSLTTGTLYYYRVRSTNGLGDSSASNVATATTIPAKPAAPTTSGITSAQITVNWTGTSEVISGYYIQRSTNTGGPWSNVATVTTSPFNYTDNSVGPATSYYYRIIAYNAGGSSTPSDPSAVATTSTANFTVNNFAELSAALASAGSGQSIAFGVGVTSIAVTAPLTVPGGVTIFGGECGTAGVILDGGGTVTDGLTVHGSTLINLTLQGFTNKQLNILTPPGRNILRCTKVNAS